MTTPALSGVGIIETPFFPSISAISSSHIPGGAVKIATTGFLKGSIPFMYSAIAFARWTFADANMAIKITPSVPSSSSTALRISRIFFALYQVGPMFDRIRANGDRRKQAIDRILCFCREASELESGLLDGIRRDHPGTCLAGKHGYARPFNGRACIEDFGRVNQFFDGRNLEDTRLAKSPFPYLIVTCQGPRMESACTVAFFTFACLHMRLYSSCP